MSTTSPQQDAAIDQAQWQAMLSGQLAAAAMPGLQGVSTLVQDQLAGGPDQIPPFVKDAFKKVYSNANAGFDMARQTGAEGTAYRALTSGAGYGEGSVRSSQQQMAWGLENDRQQALKNIQFTEARAGMSSYNALLNALGTVSSTSFGLAQGFGSATNSAIGGLSNQSQAGGALGGALAGAGALAGTGNPWAIAGGAIGGGILGALGSG